ncbi:hypothetical protein [Hyphomonas jannaschiana]|uniref:hypothetical protein n=1 Tax=Hyphomonas jannaschiana TaxID=86 RepID=UPI0035C74F4D
MTDPGDPKPDLPERAPARPVWLFWLIPMAMLVGIVWYVLRGDRSPDAAAENPAAVSEAPPSEAPDAQ